MGRSLPKPGSRLNIGWPPGSGVKLSRIASGRDALVRNDHEKKESHDRTSCPGQHQCQSPATPFSALVTPSAIREWWNANRAIVNARHGGYWMAAWGSREDQPDYVCGYDISDFETPPRLEFSSPRYAAQTGDLPFGPMASWCSLRCRNESRTAVCRYNKPDFPTIHRLTSFIRVSSAAGRKRCCSSTSFWNNNWCSLASGSMDGAGIRVGSQR